MNNDDIQKIIPISPTEKLGFYIGKFDPIHIGHIQLLLDGLKYFDKIFLLITDNCITLTTERYNIICNTIDTYSLKGIYPVPITGDLSLSGIIEEFIGAFNKPISWLIPEKTYLELPKHSDFNYLESFPKVLYSNNNYDDSSIITTIKPTREFKVNSSDIRNMFKQGIDPRPLIGGLEYSFIKTYKIYT